MSQNLLQNENSFLHQNEALALIPEVLYAEAQWDGKYKNQRPHTPLVVFLLISAS